MLKTVQLLPITDAAFAPFGTIIQAPVIPGQRNPYTAWLGSERAGMTPRLHTNHVSAAVLPYTIDTLERHPYSAQIFIPLDVARYIVVVAPEAPGGGPDVMRIQAFLAPGNAGIVYRQSVWHAGASVLDRPGSFAVLMWRNDTPDDEEFISLGQSIELHL
jgi:ureidoglycolate lyase